MIANRTGISIQLVPGFLQLNGDYEQIHALEDLIEDHQTEGNCKFAKRLVNLRQQLIYGYGLDVPEAANSCSP